MTPEELIEAAREVRSRAHAPYSQFFVGAALLAASGQVYTGCNVENASYGLTICAERNAIATAVAAGEREFTSMAIVSQGGIAPCGACRQVLREFSVNLTIYTADETGPLGSTSLDRLLPQGFSPSDLTSGDSK